MFGIGAGEFIFIILIVLMFFGSDKIPEMARTLGKGIAHLKNATNDIKSEIHKGVEDSGLDAKSLTGGISEEIAKAKEGFSKVVQQQVSDTKIKSELDQVREKLLAEEIVDTPTDAVASKAPESPSLPENHDLAEIPAPIKRQQ